ncbi:MAG: hypothetical protein Q9170_001928 [Blastenia crenularia]
MSDTNTSPSSEQGAMKQWDESSGIDKLDFQVRPETTYLDLSKQNPQSNLTRSPAGDSPKPSSEDSSAGLSFLKTLGDPVEVNDFAAFRATALDLGTQQQIPFSELLADTSDSADESNHYPVLHELKAPSLPYFGNSSDPQAGYFGVLRDNEVVQIVTNDGTFPEQFDSFADFLQGQADPEDQSFWDDMCDGPTLNQFDIDPNCLQVDSSADFWNAGPTLDELPPAEAFPSLPPMESLQYVTRPPPLPLHSKPSLGLNIGLQQKDLQSPKHFAVAPMYDGEMPVQPDEIREWTPIKQTTEKDPEQLALSPSRKSRKRKAAVTSVGGSPGEAPSVSHLEKKLKMDECAIKMAYVQGLVKHIKPGQTLNARTTTIHQFDASKVYDPLPYPSTPFSIFQYTETGELEPGRLYTPSEIQEYLYSHPLHILPNGDYRPKEGGLRLWVQRNPADSARRYPSPQSNRCRFTGCFATHNVINQGHTRVCFDEQTHHGVNNNPFHASAFIHLNCLERFLDFPAICRDFSISPENRKLPLEPGKRNRMLFSPESSIHVASNFICACETGTLMGYPTGARPHKGTLTWRLMSNKVEEERPSFRRQHQIRGNAKGSQLTLHLGDLEVEARFRDKTRRSKYQEKRKRESDEESEEELEPRAKRKYTKRNRA